jgi:hypothetical protein
MEWTEFYWDMKRYHYKKLGTACVGARQLRFFLGGDVRAKHVRVKRIVIFRPPAHWDDDDGAFIGEAPDHEYDDDDDMYTVNMRDLSGATRPWES